jgi:hypothetical protein
VVSVRLMAEVLDHYHGNPRRKLWLVAFAEFASDETRAAWPSRRLIAARVGVSVSRCSSIASELVAEGVIKRDESGRRGHGSTRYVLAPLDGISGNGVRPERTLFEEGDEWPW